MQKFVRGVNVQKPFFLISSVIYIFLFKILNVFINHLFTIDWQVWNLLESILVLIHYSIFFFYKTPFLYVNKLNHVHFLSFIHN